MSETGDLNQTQDTWISLKPEEVFPVSPGPGYLPFFLGGVIILALAVFFFLVRNKKVVNPGAVNPLPWFEAQKLGLHNLTRRDLKVLYRKMEEVLASGVPSPSLTEYWAGGSWATHLQGFQKRHTRVLWSREAPDWMEVEPDLDLVLFLLRSSPNV